MKNKIESIKRLFILAFCTSLCYNMFAQVLSPVQVNTILTPPYSPFFSDLYKPGGKGLVVSLLFKDFSEPSWDIKLRIRIEGNSGLTLVTNPDISYAPITIFPGVPLTIDGDEWSQYLEYNNLKVESGDASVLKTRGVLPEGLYTFCIEALDARSGKLLSNNACASGQFILGGIPQVISPKGNYILPNIPQNIIFQWIMTAPPLNPALTEYKLLVYEVTTEGVAPEVAIKSNNALKIYESEPSSNLQLTYDAAATNLEIGKRYVYQVKVQDKNGEALFRNDGLSEPGWFMYGYPTGGKVELAKPEPNYQFSPKDQQLFKWAVADNKAAPSQPVSYYFRVVKIAPSDTNNLDEAIKTKEIVYEETTRGSTSNTGWETIVKEEFERAKWFAWKVEAFSGEQKVAESKVSKFRGRPTLEKFLAGDHEVTVLKTNGNDINKLSGTGRVNLDRKGEKFAEVDFKDIKLKKLANEIYVLEQGELFKEMQNGVVEEIKSKDGTKASIFFTPNAIKLDKNMLRLRGKMEVPIDLVIDGEKPKITSENTWVDYNTFKITGGVKISGKYDLMEPLNFSIVLDTNTSAFIGINGYDLMYYGSVALPENSQSADGKRITLPFVNLKELTYIELDAEKDDIRIPAYRPIPNVNFLVQPKKFVIDFSDKKSPANFPKDWKGAYIPNFDLVMKTDFDTQKRILFDEEYKETYDLANQPGVKNWFLSTGLFFNYNKKIDPTAKMKFNSFPAKPDVFDVLVENGNVKSGVFKASIEIPILDEFKNFKVSSKITNDGFLDGLLEDKIEGKSIVFSEKSPEAKGVFTIKRIKFSESNNLDMTVDVNVPGLKINVNNQAGFKIFGSQQIGFDKPNGECNFEKEMVGILNGVIEVNIAGIGGALMNGKYLYYMKGALNLSDDFTGPGGEPLSNNFYGSIELEKVKNIPNDYDNKPRVPISSATINKKSEEIKTIESIDVEMETPVAGLKGTLEVRKNDPEWGDIFTGTLTGFIYAPTKIKAGSSLIIGKAKDGTKYWFFEAYAADEGTGFPIIPGVLNAVGIEGKIFGNMSAKVDPKTKAVSMGIDKNVKYGGALYIQLIDAPTNGVNVKADLGLEMTYREGDFQLAIQAEGTFVNLNGRTSVPGPAADAALKPLTEKAVGAAIAEINKQSIKIGDWVFNPNIKTDLTEGGLKAKNGNTSLAFGANVSQKYGYFNFDDQDWKLDIAGSSTTKKMSFNLVKKTGSTYGMGLAYFPGDSASVNFSVGNNYAIKGSYLEQKRKGSFFINYDGKKVGVMSDLSEQAASIELSPNPNFNLYAYLNKSKEEGSFKLKADGHTFDLVAKRSGYASLKYDKNLEVLYDKENKDGKLNLNIDGNQLLLAGNPQGGEFKFANSNFNMNAGVSSSDGKGFMKYIQGTDREYTFDLDTKNKSGLINITESDKSFALGAGKAEGMALFKMTLPDFAINSEANIKNTDGFFELKKDDDTYLATLNTDSAVFSLDRSDLKMKVAGYKNKSGLLGFSKDGLDFYVQGNAEGKGWVKFNNEDFKIAAQGDKNNGIGALSLNYKGNDSLNLYIDNKLGKGRFTGLYGDRFVSGYLDKSGRGGILMNMPEFNVALAGDKAGYGKIYFSRTQDNILIDVDANKSSLDGHSRVVVGNDSVVTGFDLNEGKAELKSTVQGTIVNGYMSKDGIATAYFKSDDKEMNANVTPKGINTLLYTQPQLSLSAEGNKPKMNAKMSLHIENDSIRANFDKQTQIAQLDATFANYSVGANVENKEGKGKMYYLDQTHKLKVQGDKKGAGQAEYEDGEHFVTVLADKVKSNLDVSVVKNSDSIYVATREKKQILGRIKIENIKTSFDIAKAGDKSFAFSDQDNLFNISTKIDKTIILNSTIKNVSLNVHSHADGRKLLYYKNNNDSLSAQIDPKGDKIIKAFLDNNLLDVQNLKSGDKLIHFVTGVHDFTASKTASNHMIDYIFDSKRLKIDKETLLINNGKHELLLKSEPNKKRMFIDGKEVTLTLGMPFDFEGMTITYLVENEFHFLRVKALGLPSFDVGFNELGFPSLNVKFPNFDLNFKGIALGFNFGFGGIDLKLPDLDFLKFNLPNLGINFKGFDLDLDIEDAVISFPGKFTFDLKWKKDFNFNINLEKIKMGIKGYYFAFDVAQNFKLEFPDASRWFSYNLNTDIFNMAFDKFKFDYEPLKLLSFSYDTKFFKLFDTGIELGFDSKLLAFEIDKHLKFNFDANKFFKITPLNMNMDWDKLKFGISMDSLRFAFTPLKLDIIPDLLKLDYNGKLLTLDALKNLKFYYDPSKIFAISPLSFKVNWGKYAVSFGKIDPLSFTDGLRNFKISGDFLSLSDMDLDLKYNFGLDLQFKYKMDMFSVSLDKIYGKWGKYDFGFGKIDGITFNFDTYKFAYKDILRLDIDGRWMAYNFKSPKIELNFPDLKFGLNGWLDQINFNYSDYNLSFGKIDGLKYWDKLNAFSFGDDLFIKTGLADFTLGIKGLKMPEKLFYFNYKDYNMSFNPLKGIKFAMPGKWFSLGTFDADLSYSFNYDGYDFMWMKDYLKLSTPDYGIIYGGERVFGITHKKSEVSFMKDQSLLMKDGEKGVNIDADGIITLINGSQKIIAGGDQPIKFKDANGMEMKDGSGSDGFNFNVAGMDFDVKATQDNNVIIETKQKMATIAISSDGEGLMEAVVRNGSTKYGTLYKNKYTWGLAVGNESSDKGAQADQNIKMTGPTKIGKITTNSTSILQAIAYASYSSKSGEFYINGQVSATKPFLCLDNCKFAAKFSKDDWYVKVAEPDKMASIRPLCMGLDTRGYFHIGPRRYAAGIAHSYRFSLGDSYSYSELGVTVIEVGASVTFGYNIEGEAIVTIVKNGESNTVELEKLRIKVEGDASVKVSGKVLGVGGSASMGIYLGGEMILVITSSDKSFKGKLYGGVDFLGEDIDFDFDAKIEI